MKRRVLVFVVAVAAISLGAAALVCGFIQKRQLTKWSSESPDRGYHVSFSGMRSPPAWPFTSPRDLENRKVTITVSSHGAILVDRAEIYDGDAYDSSFADLYPKTEWLSDNTLHLWQGNHAKRTTEISIGNESGQLVRYLYIKAGKTNLYLLFDLAAGNSVTVQAQLDHWEDIVGCKGKFEDRDFPYQFVDLSLSPAPQSTIHYNVTVGREGCAVTVTK